MVASIVISSISLVAMMLLIILKPSIHIKGKKINTFFFAPLLGTLILLCFSLLPFDYYFKGLTIQNKGTNPLELLLIFFSMTLISVILDEAGFFKTLACLVLKHGHNNQFRYFFLFYIMTAILTVFSSNDIVILAFTPFTIYFCKHAKVNPIPFLLGEFVAANTWSLFLIIGNPTNMYLVGMNENINFISYIKVMTIPTLFAGVTSFLITLLLFRKQLKTPIASEEEIVPLKSKFLTIYGLIVLLLCFVLLSIFSFLGLPMHIVVSILGGIDLLGLLVYVFFNKKQIIILKGTLNKLPYELIFFIISMFGIVSALKYHGITNHFYEFLNSENPILVYGTSSLLASSILNNIPMSMFFSEVILLAPSSLRLSMSFSSIIASNIGAFFFPLGALAGIMWMSILHDNNVKFSFFDFMRYGVVIAIPTLFASLGGLFISINF